MLSTVLRIYIGPPTLLQGYPNMVLLPPHTLQFSWDGPLDDFIDYYTVTIKSGMDPLWKFNTTELQANVTSTCGVTYECSVVPVNVFGLGKMSSLHHSSPCTIQGMQLVMMMASTILFMIVFYTSIECSLICDELHGWIWL